MGAGQKKTNKLIGYVFTNKDGDGKAVRLPRIAFGHKTGHRVVDLDKKGVNPIEGNSP
jgi:hypothetical protein